MDKRKAQARLLQLLDQIDAQVRDVRATLSELDLAEVTRLIDSCNRRGPMCDLRGDQVGSMAYTMLVSVLARIGVDKINEELINEQG